MAFKITWRPVLQVLALREYHPDYDEEKILVCVNPQPEFFQKRTQLMTDYTRKSAELELLNNRMATASDETKHTAEIAAGRASTEFFDWGEKVFLPGINDWFARLWSFGDEKFTVEDLNGYHDVDPHFLAWLKVRSIQMIESHVSARKKV